uniref:Cilia- and flagella-associated protein 206 n=1 Tax=Scophthalmus maximus TaxID=52904 RepID=A0A8D3DFA0_SCOMX
MHRARAESVIKNIIRGIVQQCAAKGHVVSDTLVAFMVKTVVLDPRNGFNVDRTLTKQDLQKLEELCLGKLKEQCSPSLDTIKMQVYFDMNYTSRRAFLEEIHRVAECRLNTVSREITDSRVKTREELDALYRKIVTYILLRSAMGSPTHGDTVQEATAALQSVFPPTELGTFMVLLKKEKEQQLRELTMVVTGIRLFNKVSKGGAEETDLDEPSTVLKETLPVVSKSIEEELSASQSLAWKYTAAQEKLTNSDSQPEERDAPAVSLKQALSNVRQHEVFLKMLLVRYPTPQPYLFYYFHCLVLVVKHVVLHFWSNATIVSFSHIVFQPLFKALSKAWSGLQDEGELLSILRNITLNLKPFLASQATIVSEAYLNGLLEASEVKTDQQRMTQSSGRECIVPAEMKTQEWFLPETTTSYNDLLLQYNGICGYTLVTRDGLLLPGNPHIGVMRHKDKLYVFSSKEAALKFATSPDYFIAEVLEKAKLSPELIQLLKLHQQFSCVSPYSEMQPGESLLVKPMIKCEISTQTDLHPMETNIVRSYEWNEWQLRRNAIKLANLRTKVTHSVQSDLSHMRRDNNTQTWLPKDASCQGKREGGSSMPNPQTYLAGLRGQKDAHVVKINLTRPVDE